MKGLFSKQNYFFFTYNCDVGNGIKKTKRKNIGEKLIVKQKSFNS